MAKENPSVVTQHFRVPARNLYNHDCAVRFDTTMGFINPLKSFELNPAERIRVTPSALIRTEPALAPIFGRARCRIYAFWVPYHLYIPDMYTNGNIEDVELPRTTLSLQMFSSLVGVDQTAIDENLENIEIAPHTLLERLGWPNGFNPQSLWTVSEFGGFMQTPNLTYSQEQPIYRFEQTSLIAVWDIFRNYFADRNRETYPVISRSFGVGSTLNDFSVEDYGIATLDTVYSNQSWYNHNDSALFGHQQNFILNATIPGNNYQFSDIISWKRFKNIMPPIKPYMPDINSAFASNAKYQEAIAKSIVRVANVNGTSGITMQSLLDGERMINFFNKWLATGGQLDEMVRAEFGVDVSGELDIPMFLRMWSFDLGFDTIFGTGDNSTGEMRGRGLGALSNAKPLDFSAKHHGKLMFLMTIEPYVDYYQGFDPMMTKVELTDLFWPSFDRIGWQPLMRSQLDTLNYSKGTISGSVNIEGFAENGLCPFRQQVGVQPAYTEYKGQTNRLGGSFAGGNLFYWTFGRDYSADENLTNGYSPSSSLGTTYINPFAFNRSFVDVSDGGMPYLVEVAFNCSIKRVISRNQLENF